ncbi:MAG TPA: YDG domain-containing protein [Tepidisphaeraceae bacterium]|nr:YDG domain-containing protein [Tepidisphaeraceae bacterium]
MRIDSTSTSITFSFITRTGQVIDTYTINNGVTNTPQVYIPLGTTWKYLDDGSNQGTAWTAPSFNDSSWSSGPAELGFGDGGEATTINSGNITTYFRARFNVSDPTTVQGLSLSLIEDQGSVIYLNGTEVYRNDMPSGAISYTTLASTDINPGNDNYWLAGTVNTAPLVSGTNVIAVELHLPSANAGDLSFDLQLSATLGQATVPAVPANFQAMAASNHVTLNWTASGGATSYKIYRGTTPGGEGSTPYATNVTTNSFTDTSVTTGSTYYYQVTAVNAQGESSRSTEVVAAIQPPPVPTNLQAASGIAQIALSWTASTGASSYNIYRGTSSGGQGASPYATNISTNSFIDAGLTPGSTFYYKVTAVNSIGESSKSGEAFATVVSTPAHVVVVIESHFGSGMIGSSNAPYLNSLANQGALFNNASGITYPGQPNYLGLFSGSTQGVTSDTVPSSQFTGANLGSELIAAGFTFGGFAEGLPAVGSLVATAGSTDSAGNAVYQRYHNPWSDFSNVPAADNVPFSAFPSNFASLPAVSLVVPNMLDDMHDGTVSQADTWLQTNLGAYATWATTHNSLLVVTWDDNVSGSNPNQIDTVIYGQQVQAGVYNDAINHYSLLRTIEDLYGLPRLGSAATATTIQDAWHSVPLVLPPPAPTSLQATSGGSQQISLTWTTSSGATGYDVYRGTTAGGEGATPIAVNVPSPTFTDSGLTPGVTYFYQVTALNGSGQSGSSNEASAATARATPVFGGLSASQTITYGAATITLSGTLTAAALIPTGSVMITINGSSTSAAINASTGAFSASFDTHAIPASSTAYTITYSYAANASYNAASDSSTTLTVNKRSLHVTATGVSRIYDGTTAATVTLSDDHINGDAITTAYTVAAFTTKNVGTAVTISVSGITLSGAAAGDYTLATTSATTAANITSRTLHVTATGQNRIYDGTTTDSVTFADDRVSGDNLSVAAASIAFADKNVGAAKTITISGISLSGTDAPNYTFNTSTTTTANITRRALTVSATGQNKTYDGTTTATVTLSDNRVTGDSLTTAYTTATFADKNVGAAKTVSVSGISLSGTDAPNYTFNTSTSTTANITPRALTVTAIGVNKIYDGTTAASVTLGDNRVAGDSLTPAYTTATFTDKNVGNGKTITVTGISLSGADAGNYTSNSSTSTTANITPRVLTVTATGQDKIYDGTAAATVMLADNRVAGDALTLGYGSAAFADKNVGAGKSVSVSGITVGGADAGNYTFNTTATTSANITARALIVTATGTNKVYDGTTTASVTLGDNRVAGDSLTTTYAAATFADKNVGTGKTITVSGITLGGADSGNYTFNTTATASANIISLGLTVTGAVANNKTYDGTIAATLSFGSAQLVGIVGNDDVSLNVAGATGAFASASVGANLPVTISGLTLGGTQAGNYSLVQPSAAANITPLALTVSGATAANKPYDGGIAATLNLGAAQLVGVIGGDSVALNTAGAVGTFSSASVGNDIAVNVSGLTLGGAQSGNYTLMPPTMTANITPLALTVSGITASDKPYDGTTAATLNLSGASVAGAISGDVVTLNTAGAVGAFASANVASSIAIGISGLSIGGPAAGNYTLTLPSVTANITPELTVSGTAAADAITLVQDPDHLHVDWFLNGSTAFGQLAANDPAGLTINGNGGNDAIILDYANGNPLPATVHLNGTFTLNNLQGTNPLAGITLDIGRSTVFIAYGAVDPLAMVQSDLQNGYNNGAWNGTPTASTGVITSLAAQSNPNHNTAIGYADANDGTGVDTTPNSVELSYTLLGDANLDGTVNSADLQVLLAGLNLPGAWDDGDFNYDGVVNSADLQALLSNLNTSLGNQASPGAQTASGATVSASSKPALVASNSSTGSVKTAASPPPLAPPIATQTVRTSPTHHVKHHGKPHQTRDKRRRS